MRVSIAYTDVRTNEPKTLRKFYRFNVLSALHIDCKCMVVNGAYMIQCKVTNATKTALFITDLYIDGLGDMMKVNKLSDSSRSSSTAVTLLEFLKTESRPFLLPDQSYSDGFIVTHPIANFEADAYKPFGAVTALWASTMGETGLVRSDDIYPVVAKQEGQTVDSTLLAVKVHSKVCPIDAVVAKPFQVTLEIINKETFPLNLQLQSKAALEDPSGLVLIGKSFQNLGTIDRGKSLETIINVCALGVGMHDLRSITLFDLTSGKEFPVESLFKIFVSEEDAVIINLN